MSRRSSNNRKSMIGLSLGLVLRRRIWPRLCGRDTHAAILTAGLVNKLEHKGYLRKTTSAQHINIKYLSLTRKGAKSRNGFRAYRVQLHSYFDGISKAELRGHINVMLRMENFLDDHHEQLKQDLNLKRGL